ncbi:hypothetical protein [Pantoea stewartii]|uniref:Uncharacterized protein n=1 Tax=Pantoea stewartii subsp. stewartii DC283 TaxID=660596 RepID=H3REV7_PANSE|nr:hypothetical protein [Pantoea stewartii]ARF50834.1 hypothetical protein DSJ_16825 [Pantoea stewartii subsp. stewartii DC283]EHU00283.1 hypothetical protein CKS_2115 [Pantoea stewartii subsp. stewartii DC283]KAB0547456.1 hypothetical protein F7Q90_20845 [Pantoea stewartii subsp. stewartii]
MRYYRLEIRDKNGNIPLASDGTPIGPFDTSETPGRGLHIEFDAPIFGYDVCGSGTLITIYGLPLSMLRQSVNLSGCLVTLTAGFQNGLPLANPHQAGIIVSGEIYNPFANWIGTNQTLNFSVNPTPLLKENGTPFSLTIDGKQGEKLSDVLRRAFNLAFPKSRGFNVEISISDRLVLPEDAPGVYSRPETLATVLRSYSKAIINSDKYLGVQVSFFGRNIRVFDNVGEGFSNETSILPHELIGQPTWIAYNAVTFKCPLRYDIRNGDIVTLPSDVISGPASILSVNTDRSAAWSRERDKVNFNGNFQIIGVRHVGSFLNADSSNSWVTIYEAVNQVSVQ